MHEESQQTSTSYDAHRHHLMLHLGLETSSDVIAWADTMLAKLDAPPVEIIDLSMASPECEKDFAKRLEPLMKHPKVIEPLRPVFAEVAQRLRAGELRVHEVIASLDSYGVHDSSGSWLLPDDMCCWLGNLYYECVNIRYIYPSNALLAQGVRDILRDVVNGLQSLADTGEYGYEMRPAVRRAKEAKDAQLKPVPKHQ